MKLSTQQDVAVSQDILFVAVTDFSVIEQGVARRGGQMHRSDNLTHVEPGISWNLKFKYRGRKRDAVATLTHLVPSKNMVILAAIGGLNANFTIEILPLSPTRSRMIVGLDLRPQTLSARLLVQSLKLTKSSLVKDFKSRIENYAHYIERQHRSAA